MTTADLPSNKRLLKVAKKLRLPISKEPSKKQNRIITSELNRSRLRAVTRTGWNSFAFDTGIPFASTFRKRD